MGSDKLNSSKERAGNHIDLLCQGKNCSPHPSRFGCLLPPQELWVKPSELQLCQGKAPIGFVSTSQYSS